MKKYIKPQIKVRNIDTESLMAASVNGEDRGTMTISNQTIKGNTQFGAKHSIWDNEE